MYQEAWAAWHDRKDHVWLRQEAPPLGVRFKCVLCGAVCRAPPRYPTAADWSPERYERLTDAEREAAPFARGG
jgi:hypothetical protein